MPRMRCCEQPENHREQWRVDDSPLALYCCVCGTVLAHGDERGDLYADY